MLTRLRIISFLLVTAMSLLGVAHNAWASASCAPAGGGASFLMDGASESLGGQTCDGDLTIQNAAPDSHIDGDAALIVTGNLDFEAGALLTVNSTAVYALIDVGGNMNLATGALINLNAGSGVFEPAGTGGAGRNGQFVCGGSGAGHGGRGGKTDRQFGETNPGGLTYGIPELARYPGSTGGRGTLSGTPNLSGGTGGGSIRIVVAGLAIIDGRISADGGDGTATTSVFSFGTAGGGGSGGAIFLRANDLVSHNPGTRLSVVGGGGGGGGGSTGCILGGGGGGGRISVYYSGVNGPGAEPGLDLATQLSCDGGPAGPGAVAGTSDAGNTGTCELSPTATPPSVTGMTPDELGQGAVDRPVTVTGVGIDSLSTLEIGGATFGLSANGITILSATPVPPDTINAIISIDHTGATGPTAIRILSADLSASTAEPLLTVNPAPTVTELRVGGVPVTGLPRGFVGIVEVHGTGIQTGTSVVFGDPWVTLTGSPSADDIAQTVLVPISISATAPAGPVSLDLVNPDYGVSEVSGVLDVLSEPVVDALTPNVLTPGQTGVPVIVTGSGFIDGAELVTDATDMTVVSTVFDGFGQLTAYLSVSVAADLAVPTRNLWVDNGDGGVSANQLMTLQAPPAGTNQADLVYADGTAAPKDRVWNGFGWGAENTGTATLPSSPDQVLVRTALASKDLLVATIDGGDLRFQTRTTDVWDAVSAPVTVVGGGTTRPVDMAPIDGAGRFLAVFGEAGAARPSYRVFDAPGTTLGVPGTNPDCATALGISWVRLVSNASGQEALLAYATQEGALCAILWNGTAFDAGTETVLAVPGALAPSAVMDFDATYWGAAVPEQAMVAWGRTGSSVPGYAVWDGTFSTDTAIGAGSTLVDELQAVRLAASHTSDRVALVSSTPSGELYAQFWSGSQWGGTVQELPFPLLSNPAAIPLSTSARAFDVAWSSVTEAAKVVFGVSGDIAPRVRTWTPGVGWDVGVTLTGPAGRGEPAWVQLLNDPANGDMLASVVDRGAPPGASGSLMAYYWNGGEWNEGVSLAGTVPNGTGSSMLAYHHSSVLPPAITSVGYNGVSPAKLGIGAVGQVLDVIGSGFVNTPAVTFNHAEITATNVTYLSSGWLTVTVNVGAGVPVGDYEVTVQNIDGQQASDATGLTVLPRPSGISIALDAGAPACSPTLPSATACILQDSTGIPIIVSGTGFQDGAVVFFDAPGVDFIGPAVFDSPDGINATLSGAVNVAGGAPSGLSSVTVVNPDTSTGVADVFEVLPFIAVDGVSPSVVGAGATDLMLTVSGRNFQPGITVDLGAGVVIGSVTWIGTTRVDIEVDVLPDAVAGGRTVTVTNLDGATASAPALFSVETGPVITSVLPVEGDQGSSVPMTITGSNLIPLDPLAGVRFSGSGVIATDVTASATQITFNAVIDPTAPFYVPKDVIITRDNQGQAILPGGFQVNPVPVVNALTPASLFTGEIGRLVTVFGSGFHQDARLRVIGDATIRREQVIDQTRIEVFLDTGPSAGSATLEVINPDGQSTSPADLLILAADPCIFNGGITTIVAADVFTCSSLTITGGASLILSGAMTLHVLGDVNVLDGELAVVTRDGGFVRLKVDGNLSVVSPGTISARGRGYRAGRFGTGGDGLGGGAASDLNPLSGAPGVGGGHGGRGGYGLVAGRGGVANDITGLCTPPDCFAGIPLVAGSGGGSGFEGTRIRPDGTIAEFWHRGGAGGGAMVLDVAGAVDISGTISANGLEGRTDSEASGGGLDTRFTNGHGAGGGAGGSILILSDTITGTGSVTADGGRGSFFFSPFPGDGTGPGGGGGRVAMLYRTASTYVGAISCAGGGSLISTSSYIGADGTCFIQPQDEVASVSPSVVPQNFNGQLTVQGAGLVAGDEVLFLDSEITGGALAFVDPDLVAPLTVSPVAPSEPHHVLVRHADQSGRVAFDALSVVGNPRLTAFAPVRLVQGDSAPGSLTGSFMNPVGAQVRFLRAGVEETSCGGPCVTATINEAGSNQSALLLSDVTVAADAPIGGYDVMLEDASGGVGILPQAFVVTSPGADVPALGSVSPTSVGEGLTGTPVQLFGYDFGTPPAFIETDLLAEAGSGITFVFDPAGCPLTAATCVADPMALQRVDLLAATVSAVTGTPWGISVSVAAGSSTLLAALTVNPKPVISGFTPDAGEDSFNLVVSGANFAGFAVISLSDVSLDVGATTVSGDDLVATVTVPASKATATTEVRVTNLDGGYAVAATLLTVNPPPVVTTLSPFSTLSPGQTGTIRVLGSHFHPWATVAIGAGVTITGTTFVDAGRVDIDVSVSVLAQPGLRDVTVTNPNGNAYTLIDGFTVGRPVVLSSITPSPIGVGVSHQLLLAGAEMSSGMTLDDIAISGSGITKNALSNYWQLVIGDVTITRVVLEVSVDLSATPGTRTLTITNPDGTSDSATFDLSSPPVISYAAPDNAVRGQTLDVALNGFNFDTVTGPRVCIGDDCDFSSGSTQVYVTGVSAISPNQLMLSVTVGPSAPVGPHAIKVRNPDGGFTEKVGAFSVSAGFSVDADQLVVPIPAGAPTPVPHDITGAGFSNTPDLPQAAFLLSGGVDPNITVATTFVDAATLSVSVSVNSAAVAGSRTLMVTNGDGAMVEVENYLLVAHPAGPTVGGIFVPVSGGGYREPVLGLDDSTDRVIPGMLLTGSGFTGAMTLDFDLAGLGVADVSVVDDNTATFTLTLAAATVPGMTALTVTVDGAPDSRTDALRVNAAPVVTTVQPDLLAPGETDVSLLLGGGGFKAGAVAEIFPDDGTVTVVDLDILTDGVQVNVIDSATARTVLDTTHDAAGDYTLSVINPDGGQGRATVTVRARGMSTPGKVAFLNSTGQSSLNVADWVGLSPLVDPIASGSSSTRLPYIASNQDHWTELRANPMHPGQYLLAEGRSQSRIVIDSQLTLLRTAPNGADWELLDAISATSSTATEAFDLAYEHGGAGRGLFVYGTAGGALLYKVIHDVPAASSPVESRGQVQAAGAPLLTTGAPLWVRLIPESGSQRILVMYMTTDRHIQALIWDGAAGAGDGAFVTQYDGGGTPLTVDAVDSDPDYSGDVLKRSFDGAWQATTGKAVVVWNQSADNVLRLVTWDGAAWSAPELSDVPVAGGGASYVEVAAQPEGGVVAVIAAVDNAVQYALVGHTWDGAWVPGGQILADATTFTEAFLVKSGRQFDMAWNGQGKLVVLYSSVWLNRGAIATRTWTTDDGWSAGVELPVPHRTGGRPESNIYAPAMEVEADPASGEMLGLVTDRGDFFNSATTLLYHWRGNGWTGPTVLADPMAHITLVQWSRTIFVPHYGHTSDVAYELDLLPPDAVVLTQTDNTASAATVAWSAPGDDGASGQAGGYDIRWSADTIVDDGSFDCVSATVDTVCFSDANQITNPPAPAPAGSLESVTIEFGGTGTYTVALKTGDRPSTIDPDTGQATLAGSVSPLSNVLVVNTLPADADPPEPITDLAVAAGANPESMASLTWTGVGDDGSGATNDPVLAYDLRVAKLPISEVGGPDNFNVPFDKATQLALVAPEVDGSGVTRGVGNSYLVTGLEPGTDYYFAVKGLDEDSTTYAPVSNVAAYTTGLIIPEPIDDLVASDAGTNDITLLWTARGGMPESYDLRISTSPIADDAAFAAAGQVTGVPVPAAAGIRQAFTVPGLTPGTTYYLALKPVRHQTIDLVYTPLTPALSVGATASATTLPDPGDNSVSPTAIGDLHLVPGTVRTHEARLEWSAPVASNSRALRYEFQWAFQPVSTALPDQIKTVSVPLIPADSGVTQEYTVDGLPENAVIYMVLYSFDRSGLKSLPSNEVTLHLALRNGMNAISFPGTFGANDVDALLASVVGTCDAGGSAGGSGPVGPCGSGGVTVTAFFWDADLGTAGEFVPALSTDLINPTTGLFVQATGTQAVLTASGVDQAAYPPVLLSVNAPVMISNPYHLPVDVASLRVIGTNPGGTVVFDQSFPGAAADGVVGSELFYFTEASGVLQYVPIGVGDQMLSYRSYFIQLGIGAQNGIDFTVEVPHP